jgi:hypothetical protein
MNSVCSGSKTGASTEIGKYPSDSRQRLLLQISPGHPFTIS